MARNSHLSIAQELGPKAGFNAYMESLEGSGLPTTKHALALIKSQGNKKAQFDFYCAKFGSKFGTSNVADLHEDDEDTSLDEVPDVIPAQTADPLAEIRAEVERLQGLLDKAATKPAPAPRSSSKSKTRSTTGNATNPNKPAFFRAWAVAKFNIPTQVGATFTYKGKRRSTKMIVTGVSPDGVTAVRV